MSPGPAAVSVVQTTEESDLDKQLLRNSETRIVETQFGTVSVDCNYGNLAITVNEHDFLKMFPEIPHVNVQEEASHITNDIEHADARSVKPQTSTNASSITRSYYHQTEGSEMEPCSSVYNWDCDDNSDPLSPLNFSQRVNSNKSASDSEIQSDYNDRISSFARPVLKSKLKILTSSSTQVVPVPSAASDISKSKPVVLRNRMEILERRQERKEPLPTSVSIPESRTSTERAHTPQTSFSDVYDDHPELIQPILDQHATGRPIDIAKALEGREGRPLSILAAEKRIEPFVNSTSSDQSHEIISYVQSLIPRMVDMDGDAIVEYLLKNCIVHVDDRLVILNKPYGLSCEPGPKIYHPPLFNLMPALASGLSCHHLHMMNRLDRTTSGLLIIAKSKFERNIIRREALAGRVTKSYQCIVKGIPTQTEGMITKEVVRSRIPGSSKYIMAPTGLKQSRVSDKYLSESLTLERPRDDENDAHDTGVVKGKMIDLRPYWTHYKLLRKGAEVSLLECSILLARKHQIRVHLGQCLRHPILGDSKYTSTALHSRSKRGPHRQAGSIPPQRLHNATLRALNIRQARARDLPIMLHSSRLQMPARKIDVVAPLPVHFRWLAGKLRLRVI